MSRDVPGQVDWRDLYRPTDTAALRAEALRLQRTGLQLRDIGRCLRLSEHAVRALLDGDDADSECFKP